MQDAKLKTYNENKTIRQFNIKQSNKKLYIRYKTVKQETFNQTLEDQTKNYLIQRSFTQKIDDDHVFITNKKLVYHKFPKYLTFYLSV